MGQVGGSGTAWTVGGPPVEVGMTGKANVQTGEGVGGTDVLGSGTAETGLVSEEDVPHKTEVQTLVRLSGT